MKLRHLIPVLILCAGIQVNAFADDTEDSLGLPGDNLDLYGVLDLYKQAASMEDFEKALNNPDNQVNNLDLNNDGNVDYLRVVDNVDGDAHAIVIQDPVSDNESQDVAAIEIEKKGDGVANLQIVGDEELYGTNYIVEPSEDNNLSSPSDAKFSNFRPTVVIVNVWAWPCVRFIYAPAYVVWISPWRWAYYPVWYHPWHPVAWRVHHGWVVRYHHPYYHCVHECRMTHAHQVYYGHRTTSAAVHRQYQQMHAQNAGRSAGRANAASSAKTSSAPRDHGSGNPSGKTSSPNHSPQSKGGQGGHSSQGHGTGKTGGPQNKGQHGGHSASGHAGGGHQGGGPKGGKGGGGGRHGGR
ncbi:MAG TPA: hypothetical protein VFU15_00620 [Bacteroidia bacterium]|nr:hypothetical protein [Bacteroidia bacterium]